MGFSATGSPPNFGKRKMCQNTGSQSTALFLISVCSIHCFKWNPMWEWGRVQTACYLEALENYALTHTHYVL